MATLTTKIIEEITLNNNDVLEIPYTEEVGLYSEIFHKMFSL